MSISKRDQKLLLVLLGIAIFLVAYLGVANAYDNKTIEVQSQIDSLTPRLTELRGYSANLSSYQDSISKIEDNVNSELSNFPSDVRSEDMVMYANDLQGKLGLKVQSITMTSPELISQFSIPKETSDGFALVPMAAMRTGLALNCNLNYDQLKKLIDYIYSTYEKTSLSSVSVSYNAETGGLTGSILMEKYFVFSEDIAYEATDIPSVSKGTADPFGTFSVSSPPADTAGDGN